MSTKQKRKAKPTSEKPTKAKGTRATRTKKKPEKKVPSTRVGVKEVEAKPELKKPVEVKPVETKKPLVEVTAEIKPAELKPAEVRKPEVVEVKVEPQKLEAEPIEAKAILAEAKPEPQKPVVKPVEVKKDVMEVKPEPKKSEVKLAAAKAVVAEAKLRIKKPAAAKLLPKPIPKKKLPQPPMDSLLLIIRLRGTFAVPHYIERTLLSLRLGYKYNATLAKNSPSMIGMLRQVKDYVTWGDVKPADVARLLKERGEVIGGMPVTDKFTKDAFAKESIEVLAKALASGEISLKSLWEKGVKSVFRLHPPSGGFESTIKRSFTSNGQLGYRGTAIATLMTDMT